MDETPPNVLRERLRKAREGGEFWKKEFTELQEFTSLEHQVLKTEMESQLIRENEILKNEVNSLSQIIEKNDEFLEGFSARFEDKRAHFTQMRSRGGISTVETELLLDNVVATFDELSMFLENRSIQKTCESFTQLDTSALSTIEEGRESVDSSTAERIRFKSMDLIKIDESVRQSVPNSPGLDESSAEKRISELQKVSTLLSSEVAHCMYELDSRDNQITLLEHSLPLASQPSETSSSELWVQCGKELESLEMTFHDSESHKDEFACKLENVFGLIRRAIGDFLSSPKYGLPSEPLMQECSSANESLAPLADATYCQQLCSVVFEASVNTSAMNISTVPSHNHHLSRIANDVRSLRNCALNAMSDFSSEIFNAVNQLVRLETMLLQVTHNGNVSVQDPLSIRYRDALIQDFQDKANRVFGPPGQLEPASSPLRCDSSTSISFGLSSKPSGSIFYTADDETSQYTSATDGEDGRIPPDVGDSTSEYLHSMWRSVSDLKSTLHKLRVLRTCQENHDEAVEPITCSQVLAVIDALKDELVQVLNESYDPNCTELLSMNVSLLRSSPRPLKPLQHNVIESDGKENVYISDPKKTLENWGKLIHDSTERLEQVTRAKNDLSVKLSQKSADYNVLLEDLSKLHSSINLNQQQLAEKEELIKELNSQIVDKDLALGSLENEANRLGTEIAIAEGKITDLNRQLEHSVDSSESACRLVELERIIADLRNTVAEGMSHKAKLEEELEKVASGLVSATTKVTELESSNKSLYEVLTKTQNCLEVKEKCQQKHLGRVQELEELNSRLKSSLEKLDVEKQAADQKVAVLSKEVQSLEDQLAIALAEMRDFESVEQAIKKELELTRSDQNKQLECIQELRITADELRSTIEGLEASKRTVEDELLAESKAKIALEEELKEAKTRLMDLEDALEAAQKDQELAKSDQHKQLEGVQELQKTVDELRSTIEGLEASKRTVEDELLAESKEKIALEEELKEAKTGLMDLEDALEAAQIDQELAKSDQHKQLEGVQELQKTVDELRSTIEGLEASKRTVEDELLAESKAKIALEEELKEAKTRLMDVEDALEAAQKDQELAKSDQHKQLEGVQELQKTVDELRSTIEDLEASKRTIEDELFTESKVRIKLEEDLKGVTQKAAELEATLHTANANPSDEVLVGELNGTVAKLKCSVEELERSKQSLNEKLSDEIRMREKLAADLVCKTDELANAKTALKDANDVLTKNCQRSEALENERASKIKELEDMIQSLRSSVVELETLNTENTEELSGLLTEKEKLESRLKHLSEELVRNSLKTENLKEALDTANHRLEADNNEETKRLQELENTIAELEASKSDLKDALNAANSDLLKRQNEAASTAGHIQQLENTILELKHNLNGKEIEIENLTDALQAASDELKVAQTNMKELRASAQEWQKTEEKLRSAVEDFEGAKRTISEELSNEISSKQKLILDLEEATVKVDELKGALQAANDELEGVTADRNRLENNMKEAAKKLEELKARKEEFENDFHKTSDDLVITEAKVHSLELELAQASAALANHNQHVLELESKLVNRTLNFNKLILNCRETLRERDQRQSYLQIKVAFEACESQHLQKKLSDALEENMEMKSEFVQQQQSLLLQIEEMSNHRAEWAVDNENTISELRSQLQVAESQKSALQKSLESSEEHCEDFSLKLMSLEEELEQKDVAMSELRSQLMTVQSQKAPLEEALQAAEDEKTLLRKSLESSEELCDDFSHKLASLKEEFERKDVALGDMTAKVESCSESLKMVRNNWNKLILDSKVYTDKLLTSERHLKFELEKVTKNTLSEDVAKPGSQLSGESTLDKEDSAAVCTPSSRSSSTYYGQGLNSRSSMGSQMDDDYDVNTYNATVTFERSMFVSDLPTDRTMCAVDPLSLTIVPENVMTPTRVHRDDDSSDEESEFFSPVSVKGGDTKSPGTPNAQSPTYAMNRLNLSKKMVEYQAIMDENKVLREKLQSHDDELITLQSQLEKITANNAESKTKLKNLVTSMMLVLYNSTNELDFEDSLSMLTQDMAKVRDLLLDYLGQPDNGLLGNAYLLLTRLRHAESQIKSTFNDVVGLSQDQKELKSQMEDLYSLKSDFSRTSSAVGALSNLLAGLKLEHEASMKELSSNYETLQATFLNASLEKETLRDQLSDVLASKEELKSSFEKKLNDVMSESEETLIHKNDLEKAILEVLRLWYKDELSLSKDLAHQLRVAFAEAIEAKNSISQHLREKANFKKNVISTCKELKNKFNCTVSEIQSLQEEAQDAYEKISSIVAALNHAQPNNQAELQGLKAELEKCHQQISRYDTNMREQSSEQNARQEELVMLKELNIMLTTSNTSLSGELEEYKVKTEELRSSNQTMSKELAKLQNTIINVERKLSETEAQLASHKRKIEELSSIEAVEPAAVDLSAEFDFILSSMITSSSGKPIDLKCNSNYEILHKLKHVENVISSSNEVLCDIFSLVDVHTREDMNSLDSLYTHLKNNDIKDMVRCKEKFASEIHGLETDSRVEELVRLTLDELQTRFMSAIMQRYQSLVADLQADFEKQLASKTHKLNQMEERVKYMEEMNEEVTKANEKLEDALEQLKFKIRGQDNAEELLKELTREKAKTAACQEERLALDEIIGNLKAEVGRLERASEEHSTKMNAAVHTLQLILHGIEDDTSNERGHKLHQDLSNEMREIVSDIFIKLKEMKERSAEASTNELATSELKSLCEKSENELAACRKTLSLLEAKLAGVTLEIETKDAVVSRLESDKANLELQIIKLKGEINRHEEKVSSALSDEKKELLQQLETRTKYIEELAGLSSTLSNSHLDFNVKEVARHCRTLKEEFVKMQHLALADSKTLMVHFEAMKREITKMSAENQKLQEIEELRNRLCCLDKENALLSQEKESFQNQLKDLEQRQVRSSHDDKTCPYKDKVQECKRELLIIRDKADGEKRNFEIMKKNLQEDLELKSSAIKSLEERNSKKVSEFMQRLVASTTSSNQLAKKLEETEEKISLLREMHAQDKKRLEKDVENLVKENASLLVAKDFVESIGVDSNKIHEALPDIQKKLLDYQTLREANEELKWQNGNLDEECETLLKQIRFLETRNSEIYKDFMEATEKLDELKKEHVATEEILQKNKALEEELVLRKESEAKMVPEFKSLRDHLEALTSQIAQEKSSNEQLLQAYKQLESNLESRNQKMQQYITAVQNYEATIATQTKTLNESNSALENKNAQLVVVTQQNHELQTELERLKNELISYQSQLSSVGCQLRIIPELELQMKQLAEQRDEALRQCQAVERQITLAEKVLREKERQIEALKKNCDQVMREKKEADNLFKAREKETMEKLGKMKEDISAKVVRIVELESVLETSQSELVASYQAKVSALESEVELLKKESSRNVGFLRPSSPVVVVPTSSQAQPESPRRREHDRIISDLEKKITVLKRLCHQRRQKYLSYENILRQNNIPIPNFLGSS